MPKQSKNPCPSVPIRGSSPAEVTDAAPRDPAWDAARETADQIRTAGRLFLRGQVRLGMLLAAKKKEHGITNGKRPSTSADSAKVLTWPELVEQETGYSRRSADVFISLFDRTKTKLKTAKKLALPGVAKKDALVLFQVENPLTLTPDQWAAVDQVIASLTDGETQASLMQELGILPKPKPMPKNKGGGGGADQDQTAGQLAFDFFYKLGSALIETRTSPFYQKLLLCLPIESTKEGEISLTTLEAEALAIVADIQRTKSQTAKQAKGKTIN